MNYYDGQCLCVHSNQLHIVTAIETLYFGQMEEPIAIAY